VRPQQSSNHRVFLKSWLPFLRNAEGIDCRREPTDQQAAEGRVGGEGIAVARFAAHQLERVFGLHRQQADLIEAAGQTHQHTGHAIAASHDFARRQGCQRTDAHITRYRLRAVRLLRAIAQIVQFTLDARAQQLFSILDGSQGGSPVKLAVYRPGGSKPKY